MENPFSGNNFNKILKFSMYDVSSLCLENQIYILDLTPTSNTLLSDETKRFINRSSIKFNDFLYFYHILSSALVSIATMYFFSFTSLMCECSWNGVIKTELSKTKLQAKVCWTVFGCESNAIWSGFSCTWWAEC